MKTIAPILILIFLVGCSKPEDKAVLAFGDTLKQFPQAGMMTWENGLSNGVNTKSNNPEKVFSEIQSEFKCYTKIGPMTYIKNLESDFTGPVYGIRAIRTDTTHTKPEPPIETIILIYNTKTGSVSWSWRDYDMKSIVEIKSLVDKGIAERTKK